MALSTSTVGNRMFIGDIAERRFTALLLWHGILAKRVGQENWLPGWVHEKVRFVFDDDSISMLKHFPDLATNRALIQVKSAPAEQGFPSVTIEQASYNASHRLYDHGIKVLIVWLFQDEQSFFGNWVENITPKEPNTARSKTNGSHTPYYTVDKRELKNAKEFLKDL